MNDLYMRIRYLVAASFLVLAVGCAQTQTSAPQSTAQYMDDTAITAKVKSALLADPAVSGLAVNVETDKGTVQLSGFANSENERARASELASQVNGVSAVRNDIRLKY